MKKVLQGLIILVFFFEGKILAKECSVYKRLLLPQVMGYCWVAEGVLKEEETHSLKKYILLNQKEVKEVKAQKISPTIADVKEFIAKNGGCKNILNDLDEKYSKWCPTK